MDDASSLSEQLLQDAIQLHATDIHFHPHRQNILIFFRIFGERKFHKKLEIGTYQLLLTYFKFTSGMDIGEQKKPQNGTIVMTNESKQYWLRLSTLPVYDTESLAIRILPQKNDFSLKDLFLFPYQYEQLKKWLTKKAGIILFSGPTGSGKTTTMYTLLQTFIQKKSLQAITLENPVEQQLKHCLQVQINEKAGITYHSGLKAILHHDPDIILIGEILDEKTANFSFQTALTGHLVLSSIHAYNATGTIQRLYELGLTQTDLVDVLIAVVSLRLLPITINHKIVRRAAIAEILDGSKLLQHITCKHPPPFETFENLRKKAFAYGYISKQIYLSS